MYVYRFLNIKREVIYIGRTSNFSRRIRNEHFTDRGHLPAECYRETEWVEFAAVKSENESKVYELYLIEKYMPKYNIRDTGGGKFTFPVPELVWNVYTPDKKKSGVTKTDLQKSIKCIEEEIENEYQYMMKYLRGKDTVTWISKLDIAEANEYLNMVYMMERFVKGIKDIKDKNIEKIG